MTDLPYPAELVIYPARLVRTLDPARPTAEAVAVRGSRIRAVGSLEELAQLGPARLDDRYADSVLMPGFVEAHSHVSSGQMWDHLYVGFYQRSDPSGRVWPGCQSIEDVVARMREAERALDDPDEPLVAWGLDPVYFEGERMVGRHLDLVSATRPILVLHANAHLMTINSAMMRANGIERSTTVVGVAKGPDGEPDGELREFAAMGLIRSIPSPMRTELRAATLRAFAADARNHGATTVVDLGSNHLMDDDAVGLLRSTVDAADFPARLSAFHWGLGMGGATSVDKAATRLTELRSTSSEKLQLGHVKMVLDGSIQGFTARLQQPGYLADDRVGIWIVDPEQFHDAFLEYHRAGLTIHVHCNGDEATELFLDTLERVLAVAPRWDHRHTVTHSQLTTPAQYRRLAALGACANIFSNHLWYWGDQHADTIIGVDRASRMDAAATALRSGVPISLHSDSPVTPLDPLATASYAATRTTPSGRVLGAEERIGVEQAVHAITLGGAYLLKMDHLVGSLEAGKFADLAVLEADPFSAEPQDLKHISVRGTVVGGAHFPAGVGG